MLKPDTFILVSRFFKATDKKTLAAMAERQARPVQFPSVRNLFLIKEIYEKEEYNRKNKKKGK